MYKLIILLIVFTVSCITKNGIVQDPISQMKSLSYNPFTFDSDGDKVLDQNELNAGRHPFIADLPQIDLRFLQNYSISIIYLEDGEEKEFKIDTRPLRGQANFKYRVGDILIRNESFNQAAKIGIYNNHHTAEITDNDLTLIKYPSIDKKFYLKTMNDFKEKINEENITIENITIVLGNSIRLAGNGIYNSIKDLELDFYFYDQELRNYVTIGSKKIKRHFNAGVDEIFEITLNNVPFKLIRDGYFARGEFILLKIRDYDIPYLKTSYRQLISSIDRKTIPVIYNTPLKSKIFHVALGVKKKKSFYDIVKTIFDTQFIIEDNNLVKIRQFGNNMEPFNYLHQLRNKNKQGKWFVFTSPINRHYLDYHYSNKDKISLSYITGQILAKRSEQSINSYDFQFTSGAHEYSMPLGHSSANAEIHLLLSPVVQWGQKVKIENILYKEGKTVHCGRGNICPALDFSCKVQQYEFIDYEKPLDFKKNLGGDISGVLFLVIGENEYALEDLQKEKKLQVYWIDNDAHIVIKDLQKIQEYSFGENHPIALKIKTIIKKSSQGLRLIETGGNGNNYCPDFMRRVSTYRGKIPFSYESLLLDVIKMKASKYGIDFVKQREFRQHFLFKINAVLDNFHN